MSTDLPVGLLLDLDDTILTYDAVSGPAWRGACERHCDRAGLDAPTLDSALREYRNWYWSDPERHRLGRLRLDQTRVEIITTALQQLGIHDASLAVSLTTTFRDLRDAASGFLPGAQEALDEFARRGVRLALLTNGGSSLQRAKLERFNLERYFEIICIEEELGFGKPDPRVFATALSALDLQPADVWMVGDNLTADVAGAQQAGIFGIWNDFRARGLPPDAPARPDRIINRLAELLD